MSKPRQGFAIAVALGLGCTGCKKEESSTDGASVPLGSKPTPADGGDDGSGEHDDPPKASGGDTLLPPAEYAPLGSQPGYVSDGLIYASLRARAAQAWWKTLPLPPDLEREGARAKTKVGFDPFRDDWLEYFAVPEDAVISMTLLRPLDDGIGGVRIALADETKDRAGDYDELGRPKDGGYGYDHDDGYGYREEKKEAETKVEEAKPIAWVAPETKAEVAPAEPEVPLVPTEPADPSEIPEVALPEATPKTPLPTSLDPLRAMGFHSRFHVPTKDVETTSAKMLGIFDAEDRERGEQACAGLADVTCVGGGTAVLALRKAADAVTIDFVVFEVYPEQDTDRAAWPATVRTALEARSMKIPNADAMGGDAAMWLDPSQLSRLAAVDKLGSVVSNARWEEDWRGSGASSLARLTWIESFVAAPRLFTGVRIEAVTDGDALQARATWPLAEQGMVGRIGASLLAPHAGEQPVPTVAALCEGALMCMRTQHLPDVRPLTKRLVAEGFAEDPERVMDHYLDHDEEYTATLALGGAWANFLGTAMALPEGLRAPESTIARTLVDAAMRADGFGMSVRSLSLTGFFRLDTKYAVYALAKGEDISAAAGLLTLAGESTKPLEVGEHGTAQIYDTRNDAPRGQLVFHPPAAGKDGDAPASGWMAVVDDPERYTWLRGRETEADAGPPAYFEIPSLLALFTSFGADSRDIGFASSWLDRRALKVVLEQAEGGAPRMRARLGAVQ